jgi:hypothetical protein
MWNLDVYAAKAAECQQKAKDAKNEEDRQSWLAMADSWQQSAELKQILERQKQLIETFPA